MILLEHPGELSEVKEWKERLENMTVGYQILIASIPEPKITDGKQHAVGIKAINLFLDQYEADVAQWNQDRCDMWFFDA